MDRMAARFQESISNYIELLFVLYCSTVFTKRKANTLKKPDACQAHQVWKHDLVFYPENTPGGSRIKTQTFPEKAKPGKLVLRIRKTESQTVFIRHPFTFPVTSVTGFFSQLQSWCGFPACFLLIYINSLIYLSPDDISFVHFIALSGKAATEPSGKNGVKSAIPIHLSLTKTALVSPTVLYHISVQPQSEFPSLHCSGRGFPPGNIFA